jgi:hypothetical protein
VVDRSISERRKTGGLGAATESLMKRPAIIVLVIILIIIFALLLAFCPKPNPGKPVPAGAPHDPTEDKQEIRSGAR